MKKNIATLQVKKISIKKRKTFTKGHSKARFFKQMRRKEALRALLVDYTHLS